MLKQEAEKRQREKEKVKEKRKTRFSSIGRMFGKHKEKEVLRCEFSSLFILPVVDFASGPNMACLVCVL